MTAETDFSDWPLETVTWQKLTSRDQYGNPTYGSAVSGKAYIMYATEEYRMVIEDILIDTIVFILSAPILTAEDKVILPDGSAPVMAGVQRWMDERGEPYYTKALFGRRLRRE